MQLYNVYSDYVIIYMMTRDTIQYKMPVILKSMLYTLNANSACKLKTN